MEIMAWINLLVEVPFVRPVIVSAIGVLNELIARLTFVNVT